MIFAGSLLLSDFAKRPKGLLSFHRPANWTARDSCEWLLFCVRREHHNNLHAQRGAIFLQSRSDVAIIGDYKYWKAGVDGDNQVIEVQDSGSGIAPEVLPKNFSRVQGLVDGSLLVAPSDAANACDFLLQQHGQEQKQLSKEFVRRWLIENGFQGQTGQQIPNMTDEYIESVSERYIELYENIIGEKFY